MGLPMPAVLYRGEGRAQTVRRCRGDARRDRSLAGQHLWAIVRFSSRRSALPPAIRRAKGFSERKSIWGHGFDNAVIPVMTIAGIDLGALIGGAIITETVFDRPGRTIDLSGEPVKEPAER
jgi:hypothetical protein